MCLVEAHELQKFIFQSTCTHLLFIIVTLEYRDLFLTKTSIVNVILKNFCRLILQICWNLGQTVIRVIKSV